MPRKKTIDEAARSKQLRYYYKKAKERERRERNRSDLTTFLLSKLRQKRYHAKRDGIPFDLDEDWVLKQPQMCAVTGLQLELTPEKAGPLTPSFDKKDPNLGYTKENTQIVCFWYNLAKNQWSEEEVQGYIVSAAAILRRTPHGDTPV